MDRKKVAVFVFNMYGAMIREVQEGLNRAALEEGVKLIYFASFSDGFSKKFYNQYIKYDEGDIVSFKLPDLSDFDGLVVITAGFPEDYNERIERLLASIDIPTVFLGGISNRYYNIVNNEKASFKVIVEHVVKVHGCKNIYHVAGKPENDFTHRRIEAFKEVLSENGIPCGEDRIYFGTLWRDCGDPALDYILDQCRKNGTDHPDAIICANDYSAIGVIDACRKRGLEVPGDVIVTGYDGIESAKIGTPSITTSEQPFTGVGRESIHVLQRIWNGENVEKKIYTKDNLLLNQSCGCVSMRNSRSEEIRQVYNNKMDKMEYLAQSTTNMILSISNAATLEEAFEEIEKNAKVDTGFSTFLLCLAPGWNKQRVVNDDTDLPDEEMSVVCGYSGAKEKFEPVKFYRSELLPKELLEDPYPYYICAIHHLQYYMGYMIISPTLYPFNQVMAKSWLVNLGAMLENWRIREKLNDTVDRLENLYNRDVLTGLYNRRGYEQFFEKIYNRCKAKRRKVAIMIIDMDDLKMVNDNYGHSEGDYSLCAIAESLLFAAKNGEICLRTGGDEFVVLAGDYSDEKAAEYIRMVRKNLIEKVSRDKKPYKVEISFGACIREPEEDDRFINEISEEYLRFADTEMYKEKKQHKISKDSVYCSIKKS